MYNEEDEDEDLGFAWWMLLLSAAVAVTALIGEYTGLTDQFINSFSV